MNEFFMVRNRVCINAYVKLSCHQHDLVYLGKQSCYTFVSHLNAMQCLGILLMKDIVVIFLEKMMLDKNKYRISYLEGGVGLRAVRRG